MYTTIKGRKPIIYSVRPQGNKLSKDPDRGPRVLHETLHLHSFIVSYLSRSLLHLCLLRLYRSEARVLSLFNRHVSELTIEKVVGGGRTRT